MKKMVLLLLLLLVFGLSLFAQDKKKGLSPWGGLNGVQASVGFVNHFEGDVSYIVTSRPQPDPRCCDFGAIFGFQSISAGINYAYTGNTSFVGPKVYFQGTFAVLTAQAGVDYLSDFKNSSGLRCTPKAGLTLFGFVSVLYGRSINLTGNLEESGLAPSGMVNVQVQLPGLFFSNKQ
jgi:hypothetical protein